MRVATYDDVLKSQSYGRELNSSLLTVDASAVGRGDVASVPQDEQVAGFRLRDHFLDQCAKSEQVMNNASGLFLVRALIDVAPEDDLNSSRPSRTGLSPSFGTNGQITLLR